MNPWTGPNGKVFDLDNVADCAVAFYLVCGLQHGVKPVPRPPVVPSRVRVHRRVAGDWPIGHLVVVTPGEYPCQSNRYGAVSVLAGNGSQLGLRPTEYLLWRVGYEDNMHVLRDQNGDMLGRYFTEQDASRDATRRAKKMGRMVLVNSRDSARYQSGLECRV